MAGRAGGGGRLCWEHAWSLVLGAPAAPGPVPSREKAAAKAPGAISVETRPEASVLAAGMKGNMLLVAPTGLGTAFSQRIVLGQKDYIVLFYPGP